MNSAMSSRCDLYLAGRADGCVGLGPARVSYTSGVKVFRPAIQGSSRQASQSICAAALPVALAI